MAGIDYQARINQAVANGDYASAAQYEQQRNAKISQMNAAGTNTAGYTPTNLYSSGNKNSTSMAQQTAQATNPASAAWGQTPPDSPTYQNGAVKPNGSTALSHAGQGVVSYDPGTGRVVRTMPNGVAYYVDPSAAAYSSAYREYFDATGQDPRGLLPGAIAMGSGMEASAANSNAQFINGVQQATNMLMGTPPPAYNPADTAQQQALVNSYIQQLGNNPYTPIDRNEFFGRVGTVEDYVQQAVDALSPGYEEQYQKAYDIAAQNLGRAGLADSLYGQALLNQQRNAVTNAMMAEAKTMGLDLRQRAYDEAAAEYQAAINESQYGHSSRQQSLQQAGSMMMDYIGLLNDEAKDANDYNMQAYLAQMQQYAAAIDGYHKAGALSDAQFEHLMTIAQRDLAKVEAKLTTAQIANTNADTEQIKAKTKAILWEMDHPTNASGRGYGYGYGGGYGDGDNTDISPKAGDPRSTEYELQDYYELAGGDKNQFMNAATSAGYDRAEMSNWYEDTNKLMQLEKNIYDAQKAVTPTKSNSSSSSKATVKTGKYSTGVGRN